MIDHQQRLAQFYLSREEPLQSSLLALRDIIMGTDPSIKTSWKYGSPFFMYSGKILCYLWIDKKTQHPYIGFIHNPPLEHPLLVRGNRKRGRIFPIDPSADFPLEAINEVLNMGMQRIEMK